MSNQPAYSLGARLLGLYFAVSGVTLMPSAYMARSLFPVMDVPGAPDPTSYAATLGVQAGLLFFAGCVLLFLHRVPTAITAGPIVTAPTGFRLLGVYFVVSGLSGAIGGLARGFLRPTAENLSHTLPGLVSLVAGIIIWGYAKRLATVSQVPPNNSSKPTPLRGAA